MLSYIIKNFWYHYGWYFIFFGSILSLLCLWFFNKSSGTCNTNFSTILKTIFEPIFSPSISTLKPIKKEEEKSSKGEKKCKEFLEYLFDRKFEKVRPDFLTNPITHQPLEIDLYNEELKLAVEYNGKQHYVYNKMMHQNSKDSFRNQQYRDHIKKELCEKNGINLIIVPYTVNLENIPDFLYQKLQQLGYINTTLLNKNKSFG